MHFSNLCRILVINSDLQFEKISIYVWQLHSILSKSKLVYYVISQLQLSCVLYINFILIHLFLCVLLQSYVSIKLDIKNA